MLSEMICLNKAPVRFLAMLLISFSVVTISHAQDLSTKQLTLADFNKISFETVGDVVIVNDQVHSITIEAEAKILPLISAKVEGKTLRIYAQKDFKTKYPIKIKVRLPQLNEVILKSSGDINIEKWKSDSINILLAGSGTIKAMNVHMDKITASVSGAGDIHLAGWAKTFQASIEGTGIIEASNLVATTAMASIDGSGDIHLNASKLLNASISGSGTIKYQGNPKLVTSISGVGEITKN